MRIVKFIRATSGHEVGVNAESVQWFTALDKERVNLHFANGTELLVKGALDSVLVTLEGSYPDPRQDVCLGDRNLPPYHPGLRKDY